MQKKKEYKKEKQRKETLTKPLLKVPGNNNESNDNSDDNDKKEDNDNDNNDNDDKKNKKIQKNDIRFLVEQLEDEEMDNDPQREYIIWAIYHFRV